MKTALVLGGSRGIGKAIADSLKSIDYDVIATSKNELDTSSLESVSSFAEKHNQVDILVLNTGGPEPKEFFSVTEDDWNHYHNQLFLGFCLLLQKIKVNDGGYIFLISSNVIKEPNPKLIISSAYRSAFSSVFKILSKEFAKKQISCINIAPGPINTDRTKELIDDVEAKYLLKKSTSVNMVGKQIISLSVSLGIGTLNGVKEIDGIPFLIVFKM